MNEIATAAQEPQPQSQATEPAQPAGSNAPLIGLPVLMTMAFNNGDLASVAEGLLARIQANPFDANALMDMSVFLILRGSPQVALTMQTLAIKTQQIFHFPRADTPVRLRMLAVLGPGDLMANSPVEFLIEGSQISLDMVYITPTMQLPDHLPEHDVLYVAIGESDQNQALLAQLEQRLSHWHRPVINRACRIAQLSRDASYAQLTGLPGISMPPTVRLSRAALSYVLNPAQNNSAGNTGQEQDSTPAQRLAHHLNGASFPVIIRPIDSHAGKELCKIEHAEELTAYLAESAEAAFFVSPFIDYRSKDGQFRKYRIILIDGIAFACHMAVSARWMVHYLNADMLDNPANREEEACFMQHFDTDFAVRHATALASINTSLGLEYVGIDCAETPDGQLLIFEVDSNMIVHNMDSPAKFPYKQGQMRKLFAGFTHMLETRMTVSS